MQMTRVYMLYTPGRCVSVGGGSDVTAGVDAGTLSVHVRLGYFRYRPRRSSLLPTVSEARHPDCTYTSV